jgi:hypothetical protein
MYKQENVEIAQDYKDEIEAIMSEMKCSMDFACYKSNFEGICEVRNVDRHDFLRCMSANAINCDFSLPFEKNLHFCLCPLRIFAANTLNK